MLVLLSTPAGAATYDASDAEIDRDIRVNIPDDLDSVRGLLIHCNAAFGDTRDSVASEALIAMAEPMGFAIVGTRNWSNFDEVDDSEIERFEALIQSVASKSSHPELVYAPWLPFGFSNGGQMSYGMNTKRPSKVIAFVVNKGEFYNSFSPPLKALQTPGILISGELDTDARREAILTLFQNNRPRGALWAWAEEERISHAEGDSESIYFPFLQECVRIRYPADQSPANGPVALKTLNEYDGWLVDLEEAELGQANVFPHHSIESKHRDYGWLPNEYLARIFQAFASRSKQNADVSVNTEVLPGIGGEVTFTIDFKNSEWRKVDFHEGKTKIGTADTDSGGEQTGGVRSVTFTASESRVHTFYAVVTRVDFTTVYSRLEHSFVGGKSFTNPYAIWAEANLPTGYRDKDDVLPGSSVTNAQRYAFGLGSGPVSTADLPRIVSEEINGTTASKYVVQVDNDAVESGALIEIEISADLRTWHSVSSTDFMDSPAATRNGNTITVRPDPTWDNFFAKTTVALTL